MGGRIDFRLGGNKGMKIWWGESNAGGGGEGRGAFPGWGGGGISKFLAGGGTHKYIKELQR